MNRMSVSVVCALMFFGSIVVGLFKGIKKLSGRNKKSVLSRSM